MNNIYKVIWSKAKNCYVVASEIARSHTKSASGSEKIGGVTRRSLLASLMALSLLCGGVGVASASLEVVDQSGTDGTVTIYTQDEVDKALEAKGAATDVETNKAAIADLKNAVGVAGKDVADQKAAIAVNTKSIDTNQAAIKSLQDDKLDKALATSTFAAKTELDAKANTDLSNLTADGEKKIKNTMSADMNLKADKAAVTALEKTVGDASGGLVKDVNDLRTQGTTLNNALGNKADKTELDAAKEKITTNEGNITALQKKTTGFSADGKSLNSMNRVETDALTVKGEISNGAGVTTTLAEIDASMKQTDTNKTWIRRLKDKTTNITHDATGTSVDGVTFNAGAVTGVTSINGTKIGTPEGGKYISQDGSIWGNMKKVDTQVETNADAIVQEKTDRENAIGSLTEDKNYIKKDKNVSDNLVELDTRAKTNADNIQTNADNIKDNKDEIARVNGELVKTNNYFNAELSKTNDYFNAELGKTNNHFNTELGKTNAALQATNKRTAGIERTDTGVAADNQTVIEGKVHFDQNGNVSGVKDLKTDTIHATGEITSEGLDAGSGEITTKGKVSAGDISTGTLETTDNAKIGGNLDVTGTLNIKDVTAETIHISKSENNPDYKSEGSIIGEGGKLSVSNEKFDKRNNITEKSELNVNEKGTVNWATSTDATGNVTEGRSEVTADNIKNSVKKTEGGKTFGYEENITEAGKVGTATDKDGNKNELTQTATGTENTVTSKDGNKSTTKQEAGSISSTVYDKDGKVKASSEMKEDGSISNNATGDMTNTVGGKLTTTVAGQATEEFNGGLDTTVTGTENHTVNGKQINTIKNGQENIISGGQTNTITGGQTNNITGDQTTTITGNKTETVEGKVTENYKAGQATNVTGDQDIKVSGTQTTTATDIKRNASSGMIDTIDNDYGTNTETKVAGKTTTDVSIKGTGEEGKYIRGANESRDYLIKGTLKNSETKTAEATSTEITDGNGKTSSTIQDVTQISGSVTDGTNTSVSNVKANSIDSAVTDGSSISTINQKKNSITSQVTDGTTITKTEQDTKNITNTAKDGTITNDAKDIVNNASGNMTNTVGGDLKTTVSGNELHEVTGTKTENVTGKVTENYKAGQETNVTGDQDIYVTGKQTNKIDGDQENTIGGSQTTTVTGDISNKAENITNEANTKLTDKVGDNTRVLDSEGITDTVGGSTFKQRIDKIMMESKDVSIKAEETLTNEAKVITNKASEVINNEAVNINNTATGIITSKASEIKNQADKLISNKVGENTWENMENGKITTSIKDGVKQNLTQSDAAGTTQSTVDGGKSTVTIQNADGLADAVTDGTNTSVQNQTASAIAAAVKDGAGNENASVANATTSVNTIKSGSKANTVISTADGTSFINSEAAAPVGDGTEVKTTIKGNAITTGKVTMDYAEVMKDLGVRGNANITGKTTTGSLEVTGTSTLKGDVTMESNATVKKDLTVNGTTNLKDTNVGGKLDVTGKATFSDDVDIKKNLSVVGDVTANSYKVGDKTYISAAGINANNQKITNVADGSISEGSKDAVNGGQLYTVKNDLEGKVNKVGANAAAMANLHPMEFDPDSKWNIAAAIGNYGSETAAALGAFYRPNDDVMVNLSTAFGTGENMVGGGVSVRLGKGGNKLSREESNALKDQVNDLTARMDALLSVLNPNMSKDFPDVPENHWAYEAVSRLAGNDIVQGYPDGEFHGERTMTRYEMAEIIYNALSRGAEAEKELVEEFKPELQAMAASEKATAEKAEG